MANHIDDENYTKLILGRLNLLMDESLGVSLYKIGAAAENNITYYYVFGRSPKEAKSRFHAQGPDLQICDCIPYSREAAEQIILHPDGHMII